MTYHDPCYLGRHNQVYVPPRELVASVPGRAAGRDGASTPTSPSAAAPAARRCGWRSGIGTRVNQNRTDEAIGTGADKIAVACPFCSVMLHDGVTVRSQEADGDKPLAEVLDVASLLLQSVRTPEPAPEPSA